MRGFSTVPILIHAGLQGIVRIVTHALLDCDLLSFETLNLVARKGEHKHAWDKGGERQQLNGDGPIRAQRIEDAAD